jgi:hypothetical protein
MQWANFARRPEADAPKGKLKDRVAEALKELTDCHKAIEQAEDKVGALRLCCYAGVCLCVCVSMLLCLCLSASGSMSHWVSSCVSSAMCSTLMTASLFPFLSAFLLLSTFLPVYASVSISVLII